MLDTKFAFSRLAFSLSVLAGVQSSIVEAACKSALRDANAISPEISIYSTSGSENSPPPALSRKQKIKPPMGLDEEQMQILLEMLKNSPPLQVFDVFVIYGSRVHFDFGSKPSTISDLDIALIPKAPSDISAETYKNARVAASDLSFAVKVMVKFDLRANRSFPDLIQDPGFFNPSSIEEYVQAWSEFQLSPGARLNHALLIKDAWQTFLKNRGLGTWFTKNSIVIFRDRSAAEQWAAVLKSKGFHNWTHLP